MCLTTQEHRYIDTENWTNSISNIQLSLHLLMILLLKYTAFTKNGSLYRTNGCSFTILVDFLMLILLYSIQWFQLIPSHAIPHHLMLSDKSLDTMFYIGLNYNIHICPTTPLRCKTSTKTNKI